MNYQEIFTDLWQQYAHDIHAAQHIHELLKQAGETITNDHIALRTFNDPRVNIHMLAKPFIDAGYIEKQTYDFPVKHLQARNFEHPDDNAPKVFISELITEAFTPRLHTFINELIDSIPKDTVADPLKLLFSKTPWQPIRYAIYNDLLQESQYAAWMYAYGYRANHFTISVNQLKTYDTIEKINQFILDHGYELNTEGGAIKGSAQELLEQSSTMAEIKAIEFEEGTFDIPSCYYEFAKRYPDEDGNLYQGFNAKSADKIFESTDKAE
jgi:hypothetical protein